MQTAPAELTQAEGSRSTTPLRSVCALLTSFNRRDLTVECLRRLDHSAKAAGVGVTAVLTDDGSSDGTAEAVAKEFRWVTVLRGDGTLFWNRGMHMAMNHAITQADVDAYLWLNDDTHIFDDALAQLRSAFEFSHGEAIIVGATCDAESRRFTYGGRSSAGGLRRFNFVPVHSMDRPLECATMNGNVVLIPAEIVARVGNLDPVFEHSMGDIDYGLRAHRLGIRVVAAPGFVGTCSNNAVSGTHRDVELTWRQRWRKLTSRKELPPRSWLQLTRRHGGLLWPLYFVWPYARLALGGLLRTKRMR